MVKVVLSNPMLALTLASESLSLRYNYRELTLNAQWPQIAALIERSSVAIDGQIYQDAFAEPLTQAVKYFYARIEGG